MAKSKGDTAYIHVRVSPKTKEKLLEIANEHGGISKFLRSWIEKTAGIDCGNKAVKKADDMADIHAMSWHLSRIGNSLNQMAYVANKANLSGKVDNKLIKQMVKELMYMNIKITALTEKSE